MIKNKDEMKKIMMSIKGGDFPNWYSELTPGEQKLYNEILKELTGE